MNKYLIKHLSDEEVKEAIFAMEGEKYPSPYEFPPYSLNNFGILLENTSLVWLKKPNATITFPKMIKTYDPHKFEEFKLISLCNTTNKIITKKMEN